MRRIGLVLLCSVLLIGCYERMALSPNNQYSYGLRSFESSGGCDFNPFISWGNLKLHRRKKAVFYVTPELIDIAKEAADLLSNHIGIDLFEIRDFNSPGRGSEIYISSDKAHYELMRSRLEPGNYLAYCRVNQNYNKDTGEIYESDIVFNPILYDRERELYKKEKRRIKNNRESYEEDIENYEQRFRDICEEHKNQCDFYYLTESNEYRVCMEAVNKCHRDRKSTVKKIERELDDWEEDTDDFLDEWKQDIYMNTLRTMIHEQGHSLGYKHTPEDIENIMYNNNKFMKSVLTGRQVNAVLCAFGLPSTPPTTP